MAPWNVAQGAVWLQALALLPLLATHNTFCAWTGLAEIDSTIGQNKVHNRMSFLMTCSAIVRGDAIGLLQRRGGGEASVDAVGADLVVAEGDQRARKGFYAGAVAADRRSADVDD